MILTTAPTNGTINGMMSNHSFVDLSCTRSLPFHHSKDITSFGTAAFVSRVSFATVLSMLIIPTICMNIIILLAISKNSNLWRSSHILIGFLAVTDALVGILSMPLLLSTVIMELIYERSSYQRDEYCVLSKAALNSGDLGMGWSFVTISLITFERYIAIFQPFWYRKYIQTRKVVKITVIVWLIWGAFVVFLILDAPLQFEIGTAVLVLGLIVYFLALPACIRIVCLLKRIESSRTSETSRRQSIDRKGSITCAIMLLCLMLFYIPLLAVTVVIILTGHSSILLTYLLPWVRLFLLANSFFNPIIYISRNPLIRSSAKDILKRVFKNANSPAAESTASPSALAVSYGLSNEVAVIRRL